MQGTNGFWEKLRGIQRAAAELEFVTNFFTWLFLFGSRLAEPLMTIAAVYIVIQAGVKPWHSDNLYNVAIAIMISAPEVILPGGFLLVGQTAREGRRRSAWVLGIICSLFCLLTAATMGEVFAGANAVPGGLSTFLLWARCVTSIAYSIVFRTIDHRQTSWAPGHGQRAPEPAEDFTRLRATVMELSHEITELRAMVEATTRARLAIRDQQPQSQQAVTASGALSQQARAPGHRDTGSGRQALESPSGSMSGSGESWRQAMSFAAPQTQDWAMERMESSMGASEAMTGSSSQEKNDPLASSEGHKQTRRTTSSHRDRIKDVMHEALRAGEHLSYHAIAERAQVGYSTVKKYAPSIRHELEQGSCGLFPLNLHQHVDPDALHATDV